MSYIRLTEQDDAGVPTPPANKVNIFVDDVTGEPSMKNDAGTVTTLKGAQGDPGEGIPTGGTAGQRLAKIDGTDYNTEWVDPVDSSPLTTKGDIFVYGTDNDRLPVGTNGQALVADSTQALGVKWDDVAGSSPLTTKGDILTYDTDDARLPVGANGSILTADSAETTGIKWGDPADLGSYLLLGSLSDVTTGSVADGDVLTFDSGSGEWINAPASGGGSSPLTTKGDVYVYGSADARLPVGTDGQTIVADSTQALGVKWAAAGTGDVVAANNNTLSGNNAFTGTNTFNNINLDMDGSSSGSPRTIGFSNFSSGEYWRSFDTIQGGWGSKTQLWNYYGFKIKGNNQAAGIPAYETGTNDDPSLEVVGTQTAVPVLVVTGAASQTSPLQEWRNSGGSVLASVSASGAFSGVPTLTGNNTMSGANTFSGANSFTATTNTFKNIAVDMDGSDTTTPRTIGPSNISAGEVWRVMDFAQGGWAVRTQLYSYYGFTIKGGNQTAVPSFASGDNADASLNVLGSDQTAATTLAVTAVTSQTGDLQEWRNSSGTMVAQVTVAGKFETTDEIELTTASDGIILKSPDGTRYRVTVANGGTLSVAAA